MKSMDVLVKTYVGYWVEYTHIRDSNIDALEWKDEREKLILSFFARINTLCNDVLILASQKHFTSSYIIMRSVIESYIDMKCLILDSEHVGIIRNAQVKKEIDHLKHYSLDNPYFSHTNEKNVKASLKRLNLEYDEKLNLKIFKRFEKVGELHAYRTVYNHLCLYSHGNIAALASDNFDSESGRIVLESKPEVSKIKFILSTATSMGIASSVEIMKYFSFNNSKIKMFEEIKSRVDEKTKAS